MCNVLRGRQAIGNTPIEAFVTPVPLSQLDEPSSSQRMRDHDATHFGSPEDVIPVFVGIDDCARACDAGAP